MFERLGILTDEVSPRLEEALDWIQEQGFKHVEIRMVDGKNVITLDDAELARVRQQVESRGLYVSAVASPVFKCPLDPSRPVAGGDTFGQASGEDVASHFKLLERALAITDLLGTKSIRIFSFWREIEPAKYEAEIVAHLRRAAELAERSGKLLLLENEPSCNGGYAEEVGSMTAAVGSPALRVLWDPGNEAYAGRPAFPDGYEAVKHVLAHVHLKDAVCDADGRGKCVPPGTGAVDYVGQLVALEHDGYTGLFTIEPHYVPEGGKPVDGAARCLEGVREQQKLAEAASAAASRPFSSGNVEQLKVNVYENRALMGQAAAKQAADSIRALQGQKEQLRLIFAAAPSQNEFLAALSQAPNIDWSRITVFHMDEYIGLAEDAPQKFSRFLEEGIFDIVRPGGVHLINSGNDAAEEAVRYGKLLTEAPIDIVFLGIGENGHIAFNDPPVADFNDPAPVKMVELDLPCRQQQVNDGCFASLADVPTHAITLTIPALTSAKTMICIVPGPTKREAVEQTLTGPIATACPATILRTHGDCTLYLDRESYGGLNLLDSQGADQANG
ncbi:TIM barrel protein [Paenibacillus eucommiae]|uniref:6-phosphogluconolactonase/glucosamine-6-phosphate isomerase/deaminase/sugar phosphate isomerase/epimerase n=1 Tax=Paenibacillus eucommiae TaxID=1355755 RepID=A0ABS4ITE1_9BACL|nr:TIM barrel protein [Paenibacillus eucommiae]MBP1990846.1 6-phosphogluconolactonase/glucosamine-6-phosphate isomerase/deaminase/sugar phosphate isomerase/epimerase [Paenibacillus eucommiae]